MLYSICDDDKNIPPLVDINGESLKEGDRFRLYSSEQNCYGRPVLLTKVEGHYVTDILHYNDNYGIHFYFENARSQGWDAFEITEE